MTFTTDLRLSVGQVGLLDNIAIRIANRITLGHAHQTSRINQLAIEFVFYINRAAEILPKAWTETWYRVEVVKTVLKFVFATLVEGWFRNVDVATSVLLGRTDVVNDALWAHADIILYVLTVARVLVCIVRNKHVVGLTSHAEWIR